MWNSTDTKPSTLYANAILGVLAFSTCASIENPSPFTSIENKIKPSNFKDGHWLTINLNVIENDNVIEDVSIIGISDIVNNVKVCLGLPNKDVAQIFGVTRQTLHSYAKNSDIEHTINVLTRRRAFTLSEIIREISPQFSQSPGAMAKNYIIDGRTLLDLLSDSELDIKKIKPFASNLAKEMSKRTSSTISDLNENSLYELTRYT